MAEIRGRTIKVQGLNAREVRDVAKALHAQVSGTTENTRSSAPGFLDSIIIILVL
jgi:hypothetical protein